MSDHIRIAQHLKNGKTSVEKRIYSAMQPGRKYSDEDYMGSIKTKHLFPDIYLLVDISKPHKDKFEIFKKGLIKFIDAIFSKTESKAVLKLIRFSDQVTNSITKIPLILLKKTCKTELDDIDFSPVGKDVDFEKAFEKLKSDLRPMQKKYYFIIFSDLEYDFNRLNDKIINFISVIFGRSVIKWIVPGKNIEVAPCSNAIIIDRNFSDNSITI